jgi:crotonobetainyl-CoA:carnitine CoA-transferase CaiB-like acyl-CoA transferase
MIGAMSYVCASAFADYEGRPPLEVLDAGQQGFGPLERLYRTADGWILLSARDAQASTVAAALGLDVGAALNRETLEAAFAARTTSASLAALNAAGIACADPAVDANQFLHRTPLLRANATSITVPHERYGSLGQPGPAIRFGRTPVRIERQEPALGEHNAAYLDPVATT